MNWRNLPFTLMRRAKASGKYFAMPAIDKAKDMKAKILFLESNTLLKPAIHTYKKLGSRNLLKITRHTNAETSRWN